MAQLYRKAALERISSPEQLDQALKVTSPMSWVALAAATFAIVVVIVWSVVGKLPITVSANGIIASPVSTNALYTSESGKATSVMVFPGAELHIGDPVLTYRTGNGDVHTLLSDQVGTVTNVTVKTGDEITQGNEVARISPKVAADQVVVCGRDHSTVIHSCTQVEQRLKTDPTFCDEIQSIENAFRLKNV